MVRLSFDYRRQSWPSITSATLRFWRQPAYAFEGHIHHIQLASYRLRLQRVSSYWISRSKCNACVNVLDLFRDANPWPWLWPRNNSTQSTLRCIRNGRMLSTAKSKIWQNFLALVLVFFGLGLAAIRSLNLTYKYSTMTPGYPFILGAKGQMLRSRATKNNVGVGPCTLVSAGFF